MYISHASFGLVMRDEDGAATYKVMTNVAFFILALIESERMQMIPAYTLCFLRL